MRPRIHDGDIVFVKFQSTHPSWGATLYAGNCITVTVFQSTHPSWGATCGYHQPPHSKFISIHAPIVGCDQMDLIIAYDMSNFNPRTHRGVRLDKIFFDVYNGKISIHAPIVGCDYIDFLLRCTAFVISIHAPIVGCDVAKPIFLTLPLISIHAPIVGCDVLSYMSLVIRIDFNPRTHRGVRQKKARDAIFTEWISIHAPIVGCDDTMSFATLCY